MTSSTRAERIEANRERLAALEVEANGDANALLTALAAEIQDNNKYRDDLLLLRDKVALRLREQGVPMTRIALLANCSDSYLTRRVFALMGFH